MSEVSVTPAVKRQRGCSLYEEVNGEREGEEELSEGDTLPANQQNLFDGLSFLLTLRTKEDRHLRKSAYLCSLSNNFSNYISFPSSHTSQRASEQRVNLISDPFQNGTHSREYRPARGKQYYDVMYICHSLLVVLGDEWPMLCAVRHLLPY